jgi:hypothetical protein
MIREHVVPDGKQDGGLTAWQDLVCGRLSQYTDALETDPNGVLDAIDATGVHLLVDTAESKGHEKHDRPTDPALRCLGMTREVFARLMAAVHRRPSP